LHVVQAVYLRTITTCDVSWLDWNAAARGTEWHGPFFSPPRLSA
jgi:hypothetical protein